MSERKLCFTSIVQHFLFVLSFILIVANIVALCVIKLEILKKYVTRITAFNLYCFYFFDQAGLAPEFAKKILVLLNLKQ